MQQAGANYGPSTSVKMEPELYNIFIAVIVLHELAHAFTKVWFHGLVTPLGGGIRGSPRSGECGWLVEEGVMDGRLEVEWDQQEHFYRMDLIDRILLKTSKNHLVLSRFEVYYSNLHPKKLYFSSR